MTNALDHDQRFSIERDRVSRILSLLQRQEEIAIDLGDEETLGIDELRRLLQRVQQRHQASGVFSRLPFGPGATGKPLDPSTGIPSTGAVLLAFHAGGRIDLATLAQAMGIDESRVGRELYAARIAVTTPDEHACAHMQEAIGRYADPTLDDESMIVLVNHSRTCADCSGALENARALDERLRESIRTAPAIVPADSSHRASLNRNPMLLLIAILAVVIIAIVTLLVVGYGAASQSSAAPLLSASSQEQSHPGWLMVASEREVVALDLSSGERRRVMDNPAHDWWNPIIISPDGDLVIRWEEHSRVEERVGALRVFNLQGERQYIHRWFGLRTRYFAGWLDNQTVIFTERGPSRRAGLEIDDRLSDAPTVIAADLTTGEEWVLHQGPMDWVVPSPDGQFLAILRPARSPWPGKTIDILEIAQDTTTEPVASIAGRHLSWTGRIIWSTSSDRVFFAGIHESDLPDPLPVHGESAPGTFDFDHMSLVALGVDGSVEEFDPPDTDAPYLLSPQAISDDDQQLMLVINRSGDRDDEWFPTQIDLQTGETVLGEQPVAGGRWWNTEALWSPEHSRFLTQHITSGFIEPSSGQGSPTSLQIEPFGPASTDETADPLLTFQDATSISNRSDRGVALLRWIPDEIIRQDDPVLEMPPQPGPSFVLQPSTSGQSIDQQSAMDSSNRHILLAQEDDQYRLMHLQAWSGVMTGEPEIRDLSWLPREAVVIGTTTPDQNHGSRLRFIASDLTSQLHDMEIDPAGIGSDQSQHYRTPVYSPDGSMLVFLVVDSGEQMLELWQQPNGETATLIESWHWPRDPAIAPSLWLTWIDNQTILVPIATGWDDRYPRSLDLVRIDLSDPINPDVSSIRTFRARGGDRGIDLPDLVLSPDNEHIAIRLRYLSSSNPENATDAILVSPTADLQMTLEIIRSSRGDGMLWLDDGDWLVAGIGSRIVLLDRMGQQVQDLDSGPAAFPVLKGSEEVWYQDRSDGGQIMRIPFALEHSR